MNVWKRTLIVAAVATTTWLATSAARAADAPKVGQPAPALPPPT